MVRECSPPAREPTGHYFRDSADLRQLAFYPSSPNRVGDFLSFLPDLYTERSASLPRGCARGREA
jgi:hypothetical protein